MAQGNPYSAYERTHVETADQRQLILMLYDGAIRFLHKAGQKIDADDVEAAHNYLIRSRQIVGELLATLKPEKAGKIGQNLHQLYVYLFNRLVEANLTKDKAIVDEALRIMTTLREGWAGMKQQQAPARSEEPQGNKRVDVRG